MKNNLHVHIMGICGSGAASIATLAVKRGFKVTGCDQSTESYYGEELKKLGVEIHEGHDASHLTDDVDIVAVSPAIFDVNPDNPELLLAKEKGILMTWQAFMGHYLQKDKRVIAVSGTHGKTTTTFLTAEMLIEGEADPSVIGGSVYNKWGTGGRMGESDWFLCEADEFNRNFYHYSPEICVMNNVEMDHPECFKDLEDVISAFVHFATAKTIKHMVLSGESAGAVEVLTKAYEEPHIREAQIYVLFKDTEKTLPIQVKNYHPVVYKILEKSEHGSKFSFTVDGEEKVYETILPGEFNVANSVTASIISRIVGIAEAAVTDTLLSFKGAGRRFDKVGTRKNVPVYDDYAHHPTEIAALLNMCKEYYPGKKLLAVFEPHQISRLTLMFQGYVDALTIADKVVIWRTHMGREINSGVTPIKGSVWEAASPKIRYEEDMEKIIAYADELVDAGECDMILVIGAAGSYHISRAMVSEEK